MRLRFERVREENEKLDVSLRDLRADLLIASERTALQTGYRKLQLRFEQRAGCPCRHQTVLRQQTAIEFRPGEQVLLLVIVRHQRYRFLRSHRHRLKLHTRLPSY